MSEYWKSTPKYWCKHCSTYVRDTKLERNNHEATSKHQYALKRFLRDLHRNHENEEREKDRAKREIDRLNGITTKPTASSSSSAVAGAGAKATPAQRQQQWEQLAEMGVDVPTELRRDMALAGEWTVTNTRIINDTPKTDDDADSKSTNIDAVATGVRKRPKPEDDDEKEAEEGVQSLFKKPKKWGRDTKHTEEDPTLDALLGIPLSRPPKKEEEEDEQPAVKEQSLTPKIKKEEPEIDGLPPIVAEPAEDRQTDKTAVKEEPGQTSTKPVVIFKKRKPKNVRQK